MKRIAAAIATFVCLLAGVARWVDLSYYIDLDTGFCRYGSPMARYGALAAVLLVVLLCSRLQSRLPMMQKGPSRGKLILCVLAALCFLALFVVGLAQALGGTAQLSDTLLAVLSLLTAAWLALLAASCRRPGVTRSASAWPGVLGTLTFLLLTVLRYATRPSGLVRVGPSVQLIDAMFLMLFAAALVRTMYLPDTSDGRVCFLLGQSVFLCAFCLEMPQTAFAWLHGAATLFELTQGLAVGSVGLLGLAWSWAAAAPEQPPAPPLDIDGIKPPAGAKR